MALVLLEGFDHEASFDYGQEGADGPGNQLAMKGWATSGTNKYEAGRFPYSANSRSFSVILNNPASKILPSIYGQLVVGFGVRFQGGSGSQTFFDIGDVVTLVLNSQNRIAVVDALGHTAATGTSILNPNTWYYVEVKLVVGTSGTCEVRLNGLAGEIPAATGDYGTGNVSFIAFECGRLGGASVWVDDVYVLDPTTGVNTTFLGDICVETLYPVSDGTYKQWTPDTGTTHYTRVDEGQFDGDTSYVHTATAGNKDSYGIGNPALAPTTVYGVQLNLGVRKDDAAAHTIAPLIRQSGVDHLGVTVSIGAGYSFYSWLLDQDPTGAAWLYSTVNGDEYGVELVS